jgi:hypothetical protein
MDRAWIVAVVLCLSACGPHPASEGSHTATTEVPPPPRSLPPVPPPPSFETEEWQARYRAKTLAEGPGTCDDLTEIREIPFRGTLGADTYYDRIKVFPDHYRPCLVDALDDYTLLDHPLHLGPSMRLENRSQLAHIMLVEADIIDFDLCQPPAVLAKKNAKGALAFFYWLNESTAHRDQFTACLQRELGRPGGKPRPN